MTHPIPKTLPLLLAATLLIGCGPFAAPPPHGAEPDPAPAEPSAYVGMYDSMDTAVVEDIDAEARTVTLLNLAVGQSYTLEYNDTTAITDKYGAAMAMTQIAVGDIVDVCFMKESRRLVSMGRTPDAFVMDDVAKYSLDELRGSVTIGSESYRLHDSTLIISDGRRISAADIIAHDIVAFQGMGRDIWSITVQRGHGYLRLVNDAYAIGGWIEVGQGIIQRISDNMLLSVPEGSAEVHISARGFATTRRVHIERNKETVIDLGGVEVEDVRTGRVLFSISPPDATVYIDGIETDVRGSVALEFGIHQVVCEAVGFDTITMYIKVSEENAGVTIAMDETTAPPESAPGVSDNSLIAGTNRVYIDAPAGVEVYQDGVYMGIAPVYFTKIPGSHTITLRREGHITKSYQIHLDDGPADVTYSFSALEGDSWQNGGDVSGNN